MMEGASRKGVGERRRGAEWCKIQRAGRKGWEKERLGRS